MKKNTQYPFDDKSERIILGALHVQDSFALALCVQQHINEEWFYIPSHRVLFACLLHRLTRRRWMSFEAWVRERMHPKCERDNNIMGGLQYMLAMPRPTRDEICLAVFALQGAYMKRCERNKRRAARRSGG